jgi:hypothetical protein
MRVFILIIASLISCTHGSIGNSSTEGALILNRLITILNTQTSGVTPNINLMDDQGDNNPLQFSISSNSNVYLVTIEPSSKIQFNSFAFYLGKGSDVFAKSIPKHIGEPIVTNENTSSVTERYYNSTNVNSFLLSEPTLITDDLGYLYRQNLNETIKIPRGIMNSFVAYIAGNFQGSISQNNTKVPFNISLNSSQFTTSLLCPIYHDGYGATQVKIKFKIIEIFKDNGTSKPLNALFSNGSLTTSIQQNFQSNFDRASLLDQYSCIRN